LLHFNKLDAENVILVRIVQLVVFAIICYASVIRHIKPAEAPTFRKIWNNFKMAVPIGGASILGVAIQYIDKLILSTQSVTDIAQYSVA
jgi:O-antigen/teichoic acid export membrane protein